MAIQIKNKVLNEAVTAASKGDHKQEPSLTLGPIPYIENTVLDLFAVLRRYSKIFGYVV